MRRILTRFIVLLMSVLIVFNCVACGKGNDNISSGGTAPERGERVTFEGVHQLNATETNNYLVHNNQSEYKIVFPTESDSMIGKAKNELTYFINKACGVNLISISDVGLTFDSNQKYLSLGDTTLFKGAGIEKDSRLGNEGAQIVTKGNTVFFIGQQSSGVLNAVYTFLEITLHYDAFYKDCYTIDKNLKDIKLYNYDVIDIPDVLYRKPSMGTLDSISSDYDENNYASRLRYSTVGYPLMPMYKEFDNPSSLSKTFHNTSECLPPEVYGKDHAGWYADDCEQLCYTAHGNAEEFELMAQEAAKKVENSLKICSPEARPFANTITISAEDNSGSCKCEACRKANKKYNGDAGAVVIFINRVSEIVDEWMKNPENENYRRDDFHIIFFAYNAYTMAPAVKNAETGKWEPIDDKVRMNDNVGVYLAPIDNIDYQQSIYSETNKGGRDNIDAWGDMTDAVYLWTYATNFVHYMYMYDSFNFFNDAYSYIASKKPRLIYNQMQWNQKGSATAWHSLKTYLDGELFWNSSADVKELTDRYFEGMYREAAPIMKSLYNDMRIHNTKVTEENDYFVVRSIYNKLENRNMWPLLTLQSWTDKCDEAIETISIYKDVDPELYSTLVKHIEMEWLSPAFITISLYSSSLSEDDKLNMIERFEKVVNELGITRVSDHGGDLVNAFDKLK